MSNNRTLLDTYMKRELHSQLVGPPVTLTDEEAAQYHPATDITFLERLDADAISEQERKELLAHLDQCMFCRQELERLCKSGALFEQNDRKLDTRFARSRIWENLKKAASLSTVAACLLCVGVLALYWSSTGDPSLMAHRKITRMLNADEQGFSTLLTDNGYRLSGTFAIKAVSVLDDHKQAVRAAYEQLVADYPNNINFRTEFGKYLLFVLKEPDLARNELERALELSLTPSELKRSPELHLLLGLAAFEERNDDLAQKHFRDTLDLDPKNLDAKVNLAISLYCSGEQEEATSMFQKLRSERIPEALRNQIDRFLERE